MRWRDLLRGRTLTDPATVPARYDGDLLLLRLDPDSVGIRDATSGGALRWDAPELVGMGASVAEVHAIPGSEPAFQGETAAPGTEIHAHLDRGRLRIHDEYGLVLGEAFEADLGVTQARAGHTLRVFPVRQSRDASGARTQLQVLLVPEGVQVHFRVPSRSRERESGR